MSPWLVRGTGFFGILVAGGALASWGTRAGAQPSDMPAMTDRELCLPPEKVQTAIDRGAAIEIASCAGCHDLDQGGAGPSYRAIAARYAAGSEGRSLAALARAVAHPPGGWPAYAHPVSPPPLSDDDRDALAYWLWRAGSAAR